MSNRQLATVLRTFLSAIPSSRAPTWRGYQLWTLVGPSVSMNFMRRLLMLGLCLMFALQGAVQASVVEKPCPMKRAGHAHATHAGTTAHDCCNDADTAAKTGKACKTGQACPAVGAWLTNSQDLPPCQPSTVSLVSSPQAFVLRIDSGGHWRPPALS